MTGFIKGLFRSKPKAEPVEPEVDVAQPQQKPGAYYLPPDDARTLGNVEYMRSAKSVRRTFSKKKVGEDNESIRVISAMEMQKMVENGKVAPMSSNTTSSTPMNGATNGSVNGSTNGTAPKAAESPEVVERRRSDESMDMFRNMARDLKKR
ncbi:hypothetical protein [Leptolyngbya ohadii]|uniref:hypothetical protein n=1 Tax=Leptolyngbya ohadii TaxID=1962290 RepID=UPI000B59EC3F|nr:hypothetical protein [Leptolyngbya ohadii]